MEKDGKDGEDMEKMEKMEKTWRRWRRHGKHGNDMEHAPQVDLPFEDGLARRFLDAAGPACRQHQFVS